MTAPEIVWNQATVGEWRRLIGAAERATLPQSWAYAMAMPAAEGQVPHFGVIRESGEDVGLVLALERRALSVFSRISIHRGPLWIRPDPPEVGSSRVDLQACKLEYSIVSPK